MKVLGRRRIGKGRGAADRDDRRVARIRAARLPNGTAADELLSDAHGFVLEQGVCGPFTAIADPGAPRAIALGIHDRDRDVGRYENPDATPAARRVGTSPLGRLLGLLKATTR
jgi:hypothetical protein